MRMAGISRKIADGNAGGGEGDLSGWTSGSESLQVSTAGRWAQRAEALGFSHAWFSGRSVTVHGAGDQVAPQVVSACAVRTVSPVLSKPAHLLAIPADGHRTPAPSAVLARVEEHPTALWIPARAEPREIGRREKDRGVPRHRPQ